MITQCGVYENLTNVIITLNNNITFNSSQHCIELKNSNNVTFVGRTSLSLLSPPLSISCLHPDINNCGNAINIDESNNNITIRGFILSRGSIHMGGYYGKIKNNTIIGALYGIILLGTSSNIINNQIEDTKQSSIFVSCSPGYSFNMVPYY